VVIPYGELFGVQVSTENHIQYCTHTCSRKALSPPFTKNDGRQAVNKAVSSRRQRKDISLSARNFSKCQQGISLILFVVDPRDHVFNTGLRETHIQYLGQSAAGFNVLAVEPNSLKLILNVTRAIRYSRSGPAPSTKRTKRCANNTRRKPTLLATRWRLHAVSARAPDPQTHLPPLMMKLTPMTQNSLVKRRQST